MLSCVPLALSFLCLQPELTRPTPLICDVTLNVQLQTVLVGEHGKGDCESSQDDYVFAKRGVAERISLATCDNHS